MDDFADEGVSGATDPSERPYMSKMLARLDEVDAIVFYRLDRLCRSTLAFAELMDLCKRVGVALVSCTEPLDLSSPMGVAMAEIIAVFAKLERAMIRERSMDARRKGMEDQKFVGGRFPYGLTPAPHPSGKGRALVRDEEAAKVIQRMAAMVVAGHSATAIAKILNADKVLTSRMKGATAKLAGGHEAQVTYWRGNAVRAVLRNKVQLGYRILPNGRPETGTDGLPLIVWEPVLTWDEWEAVQSALDTMAATRTLRHDAYWLQGVLRCGVCDARMTQTVAHGRTGLKCAQPNENRHKPSPFIRADDLTDWVNAHMMAVLGWLPIVENIWHAGSNSAQERREVATAIKRLREDRSKGLYEGEEDEAEFEAAMTTLMAKRRVLASLEDEEPRWETVSTGRRFRDVWESSSEEARASMMQNAGLVVRIEPAGGKRLPVGERARIEPEDPIATRLAEIEAEERE